MISPKRGALLALLEDVDDEALQTQLRETREQFISFKRRLMEGHKQFHSLLHELNGQKDMLQEIEAVKPEQINCDAPSRDPKPLPDVPNAQDAASADDTILSLEAQLLKTKAEKDALELDLSGTRRIAEKLASDKADLEKRLQKAFTSLLQMKAASQETKYRSMLDEMQDMVQTLEEKLQNAQKWEQEVIEIHQEMRRLEEENGTYVQLLLKYEQELTYMRQENVMRVREVEAYHAKEGEIEELLRQLHISKQQYEDQNRILASQLKQQAEECCKLVELLEEREIREVRGPRVEELQAQLKVALAEVQRLKEVSLRREAEHREQTARGQQEMKQALAARDAAIEQVEELQQRTSDLQYQLGKLLSLPSCLPMSCPNIDKDLKSTTRSLPSTQRRLTCGDPAATSIDEASALSAHSQDNPKKKPNLPPRSTSATCRRSKSNPVIRPNVPHDPPATIASPAKELKARLHLQEELVSSIDDEQSARRPLRDQYGVVTPSSQASQRPPGTVQVHDPSPVNSRGFPCPAGPGQSVIRRQSINLTAGRTTRPETIVAAAKKRFFSLQ